jgi:hypothetical protein
MTDAELGSVANGDHAQADSRGRRNHCGRQAVIDQATYGSALYYALTAAQQIHTNEISLHKDREQVLTRDSAKFGNKQDTNISAAATTVKSGLRPKAIC